MTVNRDVLVLYQRQVAATLRQALACRQRLTYARCWELSKMTLLPNGILGGTALIETTA